LLKKPALADVGIFPKKPTCLEEICVMVIAIGKRDKTRPKQKPQK
jgi:hypothetical protein